METEVDSTYQIYQKLSQTVNTFIESLDRYSDEQFLQKRDAATWSLGEMYEHISNAASYFFLANTVRCLEKRKGQMGGTKNQAGDNIYYYGGFPPKKFQVPDAVKGGELIPKSREEYKILFAKILSDTEKLIEPVAADEGKYKCIQPVFGWLNAYEWFALLEMHTRHHLRQKKELEGFLTLN